MAGVSRTLPQPSVLRPATLPAVSTAWNAVPCRGPWTPGLSSLPCTFVLSQMSHLPGLHQGNYLVSMP